MPKRKSHKGAAKRFRVTKNGRVKHRKAGKSHLNSSLSAKRIRKLRRPGQLHDAQEKIIRELLLED